jgi:phage-related protein (TIGR01555 family)
MGTQLSLGRANDMMRNVMARFGYGTPSIPEATEYIMTRMSLNYWMMLTLYETSWLSRRIIDAPVQDMVRAWPKIQSDLAPDDLQEFDRTMARTGTKASIALVMKWARLFGGAGALMVIDGHEKALDEPLDLSKVNPNSFRGLIPFDRWSGITPGSEASQDFEFPRNFNLPEFYNVRSEQKSEMRVHHSRILRFIGPEVPQPELQAHSRWGISQLALTYEEVRKRDNMSSAILNLMFRASILAQTNPELAGLLSGVGTSSDAASKFYAIQEAQNHLLSNQSMLYLPKDGQLTSHQYSFGGVADVYQQFQLDIAGAAEIPVPILFGRTLSGLAQSNDADLRIYEQKIAQRRDDELNPVLEQQLYPVIMMSEFGDVPEDFQLKYPPLRVLTEEEKADLAGKVATAITTYYNAGIISHQMALKEVKETSSQTGIGTNITEEDINRAPDDFPPSPEDMMNAEAAQTEEAPTARAGDAAFVESEHPRVKSGAGGGQFTAGAGGGGTAIPKGAHKTAGAFAMQHIKEGKYSDKEIAEATSQHFGTKTDLKSIAWYKNKMKQVTPEWQAKKAAKLAAIAKNSATIKEAGQHPVAAPVLEKELAKTKPSHTIFIKTYASGTWKYYKVENVPGEGATLSSAVLEALKKDYPGYHSSMLWNPSKPAPANVTTVTLSEEQAKALETQAHEQAAKVAKEQELKNPSAAKTHASVPLTPTQKSSLQSYTNGAYSMLNKSLRTGSPLAPGHAQLAANIDAAMKTHSFVEDSFVYRGAANVQALFGPEIKKGMTILDNGYLSCSKNFSTANNFSNNGVVVRIKVKKGDKGLDVSGFSLHPAEAEVVLPRGSMFTVEAVHDKIVECSYVSG